MIKLILKLKETQLEEFALEKDQITIGRAKESDIAIDNIAVSRKHAEITRKEGGTYFIRDLGSSNGTFLNGAQIDVHDHAISDGAVIGIAKFELQVKGLSKAATPEDAEGTMIFDPSRRKPAAEPQATPEPKPIRWPVLSAVKGPGKGTEYKVSKELTLVGKSAQFDIPAEGWFVSSPHAKIIRRGDRFYISHVGGFLSSTKVNGIGIRQEHILKNKDQVDIGNSSFVFTQAHSEHGE
jgi:pSer/pThr/pTyr-binding forkhead associated (FHA) protein